MRIPQLFLCFENLRFAKRCQKSGHCPLFWRYPRKKKVDSWKVCASQISRCRDSGWFWHDSPELGGWFWWFCADSSLTCYITYGVKLESESETSRILQLSTFFLLGLRCRVMRNPQLFLCFQILRFARLSKNPEISKSGTFAKFRNLKIWKFCEISKSRNPGLWDFGENFELRFAPSRTPVCSISNSGLLHLEIRNFCW